MSEESDLRARIEAQKQARRQLVPQPVTVADLRDPGRHRGPGGDPGVRSAGSAVAGTAVEAGSGRHRSGSGGPKRPPATRPMRALRVLLVVVLAVVAAVVLRTFVLASYYIPSASMEPTLHGCSGCDNDHVLVDKLSYDLHSVHRGDVVVFHRPPGAATTDKVLIKRVIGLPGDRLTDVDGVLQVDGVPLKEPYVNPACHGTQTFPASVTVPPHEVFVMGDNRCDSMDSRSFGPITESSIIGRAVMIVWPLGRLHYL